jgi:hypothetical protein
MNPRLPVRLFVTLGVVLLICGFGLAGRAAGQVQYRTVALSGQPAPGTPAGVNYAAFFGEPVLNDTGQVAYFADLVGSGVTAGNSQAIYAGPVAAPQLLARAGDAAPGMAMGVNYSSFRNAPALNDAGQVAYRATLTGSDVTFTDDQAIYAGSLAAVQLVAREGGPAPGTSAGVNYLSFPSEPALNDAGQVAYSARLTGSGVAGDSDEATYAGPLAAPQLIVREGNAAPGASPGVNYTEFNSLTPALNDAGQVAYRAELDGIGVTTQNYRAIYGGPLAAPQLVARSGNDAPGTVGLVPYSSFSPPTLNNAGHVAFFAVLAGGGVTPGVTDAIFAGPLAAPQLVAREGNAAPGTPVGVKYSHPDLPVLNDDGDVAYFARLTGPGVGSANDGALYAGPPTAPQLVAREGDAAPGTPAGVSYELLPFSLALSNAGQVAYPAYLAGNGVTSENNRGLFLFDPLLGGLLVAREGQLFDVGGDDFRTIADGGITFIAGRSDDMRTGLSNARTLAFGLSFTDGTSGIFTATIVPEPGALALLALAGLMLVGCRSAHRRRML